MKQITGSVQGQNVILDKSVLPVQGTNGLYKLKLSYDEETWRDVDTRIVTFTNGGVSIAVEDNGEEDGVTIPWEVLQASPANCGFVTIGVIGYAGTALKLTTTSVYKRNQLIVLPEILGLAAATTPTPDIYQKLTQGLADAVEAAKKAEEKIGALENLDTADKTNLVVAINEVLAQIGTGSGTVKSVNQIEPDENGNVALSASDVGAATPSDVSEAVALKQDALTETQLAAANSGIDSAKVAQIATNTDDIASNANDIDEINGKIPAQASAQNQLADKDFVNSSVATNTANFVGTFNSLAELEAVQNPTNNDYGFVTSTVDGNTVYNRYKYNGTAWVFEYALNNSSFTAEQWAAIQSGINSGAVAKLNGIEAGAEENVQADWSVSDSTSDAFIRTGSVASPFLVNEAKIGNFSAAEYLGLVQLHGIRKGTTGVTGIGNILAANSDQFEITPLGSNATIRRLDIKTMTGTDGTTAGAGGLVPAPAATDAGKVLSASGSWITPDAGMPETFDIATTDWVAITGSSPYTFAATVSASATINSSNGIVELFNDNPVLFAKHGFAIGATAGQNITFYSIGRPETSVSLHINIRNL